MRFERATYLPARSDLTRFPTLTGPSALPQMRRKRWCAGVSAVANRRLASAMSAGRF